MDIFPLYLKIPFRGFYAFVSEEMYFNYFSKQSADMIFLVRCLLSSLFPVLLTPYNPANPFGYAVNMQCQFGQIADFSSAENAKCTTVQR